MWRARHCVVGVLTRVWMVSPVSSATPNSAARFICLHPNLLRCHLDSQCLNANLGAGFIKLASASEGDWTCLLCKSAPLEKLRSSLLAPIQVGHE